jgi:ParB family chromosome partitioning protein
LKEIHKGDGDVRIACVVKDVDDPTADSLALGENYGREPMHPLDEAESFARLATHDGKDADAIAAEFGVTVRYVRQRMKLAELIADVKAAYRGNAIDTATAEAFASVPPDRQNSVWEEVSRNGSHALHAQHVRNVIAGEWIDAKHALFDVSTLDPSVVSQDLFGDQMLIERSAFAEAQTKALESERNKLLEDGWREVIVARYEDASDRLRAMDMPEREYDPATVARLEKLDDRWRKLEVKADALEEDDDKGQEKLERQFETIETEQREIEEAAEVIYSEATKSVATMFLLCLPDGQVRREVRVPRAVRNRGGANNGSSGNVSADGEAGSSATPTPTCHDLSERQTAAAFAHQVIAVRTALLANSLVLRRVLVLILSHAVRASEAFSIRRDVNAVTLAAEQDDFKSPAFDRLQQLRTDLDPLVGVDFIEDIDAYAKLAKLKPEKLDAIIELLVVECLTANLARPTPFIRLLVDELKVDVRTTWTPDGHWLSGFTKLQLSNLVTELKGAVNAPANDRKKSDLVTQSAVLFEQARERKLDDSALRDRVNKWMPSALLKRVP